MRRAGGWILGLLIVAAMSVGGWFSLRRVLHREEVTVLVLRTKNARGPTSNAIWRGAQYALGEAGGRAGRFRVRLEENEPGRYQNPRIAAWIGISEGLQVQSQNQPDLFMVSALETNPPELANCYRTIPGSEQLGRAAATWAKRSKAGRVFLLRDVASRKSEEIARAFQSQARNLGLIVEGPEDPSAVKVGLIERILAARVDLVLYSGEEAPYSTCTEIFSGLRQKAFSGLLATSEADPEVSCLAVRSRWVEGSYLISPFAPAPPEFARGYGSRMGTPPGPHVIAGYFAMKAALEAIDLANSIDPDDLRRTAARLPYFDATGAAALRPVALYIVRDGVFVFVETLK